MFEFFRNWFNKPPTPESNAEVTKMGAYTYRNFPQEPVMHTAYTATLKPHNWFAKSDPMVGRK